VTDKGDKPERRTHDLTIGIGVQTRVGVEGDARLAGRGRKGWFQRFRIRLFPQRGRPGRWAIVSMVMKRAGFGNWYSEKVQDAETGATIKEQEQQLTDHQGYGAAKFKKDDE